MRKYTELLRISVSAFKERSLETKGLLAVMTFASLFSILNSIGNTFSYFGLCQPLAKISKLLYKVHFF